MTCPDATVHMYMRLTRCTESEVDCVGVELFGYLTDVLKAKSFDRFRVLYSEIPSTINSSHMHVLRTFHEKYASRHVPETDFGNICREHNQKPA